MWLERSSVFDATIGLPAASEKTGEKDTPKSSGAARRSVRRDDHRCVWSPGDVERCSASDRPIVTRSLYNADNMPPYALPDNKTQSGIKSRSSKAGAADNFNELRFEDLKGKEEVYLQAEKDLGILVKNDETRHVQHDRVKNVVSDETTTVGGNRKEEVTKNEKITIHESRAETVDKDETITISGSRTEIVDKDEDLSITGTRTEKVGKDETIKIRGGRTETVGKDETVTIKGARKVNLAKAETLGVSASRKQSISGGDTLSVTNKLAFDAGDEMVLKSGDASITLKKDGTLTLKGKDITLIASGKIHAKASADVIIKGSKVSGN